MQEACSVYPRRVLALAALALSSAWVGAAELEEVLVWGSEIEREAGPHVQFNSAALSASTVVTTEDLMKFESSLVVRQRFIGDANGTLGIRGANMFQTSRSQVFADGIPLHYHLQSRWDGAPRWSLIAASEVAQVEILYGPYSAAYGGGAMGGVILLESHLPQRRELRFDSTVFVQNFSAEGFSDKLQGYKSFLSYSDRLGALSLYLSWNHLDSEAQPQTWYFGAAAGADEALPVSGALPGHNEIHRDGFWLGNSGVVNSTTDNLKLKLGYEWSHWEALFNLAWEGRSGASDSPNSYLRNSDHATVWGGSFVQEGQQFSIDPSRFGVSNSSRESLSLGLRVKGWLGDELRVESTINSFNIVDDETRSSARNPADHAWTPQGQISDLGNSGWRTFDIRAVHEALAWKGLELQAGLRHEAYRLNIAVHDSADYRLGLRGAQSAGSGGETRLDAIYLQAWQALGARWDLGLGLRQEWWHSNNGYYASDNVANNSGFELASVPARSQSAASPKFSLAFQASDKLSLNYSLARAWRFPIVEELFSQYHAYNALNQANAELAPERGLHQNLGLEYRGHGKELRFNLFHERVQDVIEAQSQVLPGGQSLRTFLPVDLVETHGVELVANVDDWLLAGLNLRFNLSWTEAEIVHNRVDPALEGNDYPRMPHWRSNLLLNYRFSDSLDVGAGLRYTSRSFTRLDNRDTASGVFGALDDYLFVNMKLNWQASKALRFGLGVDNLLDELAYVAHPWPGRTFFLEAGWQL